MNKRILTLLISALLVQPLAVAQEALNLSPFTLIAMQKAQQLASNNSVPDAIKALQSIDVSRPDDVAAVSKMLGVYYWQVDAFDASIQALEKALSLNVFPDDEAWRTRRMLAQLYLSQGEFKKALAQLNRLVDKVPENEKVAEIWRYLVQAHYSLENWHEAIEAANAFNRAERQFDRTVHALTLASHVQLEQWKPALRLAKALIAHEPNNKNWWLQAYNAYLQLHQEQSALDLLTLAELQGITLNQSEIKSLAALYAGQGIYHKAASTLARLEGAQQELSLLKLQAQYWQAAKEWETSLRFWKKAAQIEPNYLWEVAILQNELKRYQQVIASLDKLNNPQRHVDAQLLKVNAYYRLERLQEAYAQAKKADALHSTKQTQSWLKFLAHKMQTTNQSDNVNHVQQAMLGAERS